MYIHAKDSVEINYKEDCNELGIVIQSENEERVSHLSLKLMEIVADDSEIPATEYQAWVKIPSIHFKKICQHFASWGDTLTIKLNKEVVTFSTNGEFANGTVSIKNTVALVTDDEEKCAGVTFFNSNEGISQVFSLRYILFFKRATDLSEFITLKMALDSPLLVEYMIGEIGYIRYYLAARIED